ncbi:MAG: hypothetical protein HZA18_02675 [Nitrospirae bacterium]|nr:hypothetical protein [Nitrospirota bacterium]
MKKGMIYNILLIGITMFALVACGTGDPGGLAGGGIGGTGISVGKITAFGSVFVNGVEFETSGATITTDGETAIQDDLEIGMIVAVEGTFNVDGLHGTARSIKFKDNLEGPVTGIDTTAQTLIVLGQTVIVDATTDIYNSDGTKITFPDMVTGDTVEVSGFVDSTGVIHATYIKVKGSSDEGEIELKGTISDLDVTPGTFKIGTLVVDYSGAQIEINGGLQDGLFVEVKSAAGVDNSGMLIASKIEAEDEIFSIAGGAEGEKAELEGVVTSVANLALENKFEVNGQLVQITSTTHFEENTSPTDIVPGARLKVKGTIDANGVLIAKEISIESRDGSGEETSSDSTDTGTSGDNGGLPDDESGESGN